MIHKQVCVLVFLLVLSSLWFSGCLTTQKKTLCFVDDDYNLHTNGWNSDHFSTIQDAIDHIDTLGCIHVNPGVYDEKISFEMPGHYTLIGNSSVDTIIRNNHGDDGIITINENVNVCISGVTIISTVMGDNEEQQGVGIEVFSDNNMISNNSFRNLSKGVYIAFSEENKISGNIFSGNDIGLHLYTDSNENMVSENRFISNRIGCKIKGSTLNQVLDNGFIENRGGIYLCCGSDDNIFYHNAFRDNLEFPAQDWCLNTWNSSEQGNYWEEFSQENQGAFDIDDDGIIDAPYNISRGFQPEEYPNKDYHPLKNPLYLL